MQLQPLQGVTRGVGGVSLSERAGAIPEELAFVSAWMWVVSELPRD